MPVSSTTTPNRYRSDSMESQTVNAFDTVNDFSRLYDIENISILITFNRNNNGEQRLKYSKYSFINNFIVDRNIRRFISDNLNNNDVVFIHKELREYTTKNDNIELITFDKNNLNNHYFENTNKYICDIFI
jgi:hypothetical protein